jgi:hypothetical protein
MGRSYKQHTNSASQRYISMRGAAGIDMGVKSHTQAHKQAIRYTASTARKRTIYDHSTLLHSSSTTCTAHHTYVAEGGHVVVRGVAGHLVSIAGGRGVGPVVPGVLHLVAHACSCARLE